MDADSPLRPVNLHTLARRLALSCGWLVVLIAGGALVGWWLDSSLLKSMLPGFAPVRPNTAFGLLLGATGLLLLWYQDGQPGRRTAARILAG